MITRPQKTTMYKNNYGVTGTIINLYREDPRKEEITIKVSLIFNSVIVKKHFRTREERDWMEERRRAVEIADLENPRMSKKDHEAQIKSPKKYPEPVGPGTWEESWFSVLASGKGVGHL